MYHGAASTVYCVSFITVLCTGWTWFCHLNRWGLQFFHTNVIFYWGKTINKQCLRLRIAAVFASFVLNVVLTIILSIHKIDQDKALWGGWSLQCRVQRGTVPGLFPGGWVCVGVWGGWWWEVRGWGCAAEVAEAGKLWTVDNIVPIPIIFHINE